MDMRKRIAEQTSLAQAYADDGAYSSAARVLRQLTQVVEQHAARIYNEERMVKKAERLNRKYR